ncbi:uncharacterized protein LOC115874416 [Sitophilus oryzae]|uniref:Uncharacterized protein LOC115874416 n=1 Tax=Sitophilus oryzae TaxID=7048 RepID=A0A6J2X3D0_SITOR|nr:uncharacterized protein LOC115874416 [Sitophilus oryzae]
MFNIRRFCSVFWCFLIFNLFGRQLGVSTLTSECVKNGLYAHPTECDQFYSCSPLGPVLMTCPHGFNFNEEYSICDWPHNSNCYDKNNQQKGYVPDFCSNFIYAHPQDCSKFYLCSPFGPVQMNCPAPLHFNPVLLVCDWPHNAQCASYQKDNLNIQTSSSTPYYIEQFNSTLSDSTTLSTFTTNDETESTEVQSTTDLTSTTEGVLESTTNTVFTTTEEITFSTIDSTTGTSITVPTEELTTSLDQSTTTYSTTLNDLSTTTDISTTFADTEIDKIDVYQKNNDQLLFEGSEICPKSIWPHPNDCTRFYMCGSTGPELFACPDDLVFNPVLLVCDWNYKSECLVNINGRILEESSTTVIFEENNDMTEVTTNSNQCQGTIWAHPDCTKYYMCGTTGPELYSCPEGLYYNSDFHVCDYDSSCKGSLSLDTLTTTELNDLTDSSFQSTQNYNDGNTETMVNLKVCQGTIWAHSDSTKYYICGPTGPVEYTCPEGLCYNKESHFCDDNLSYCTQKINLDTLLPTTELILRNVNSATLPGIYEGSGDFNLGEDLESSTDLSISEDATFESSLNEENLHPLCLGTMWPHPIEDNKFYKCGTLGPKLFECPDTLYFNPALMVCDWNKLIEQPPNLTAIRTSISVSNNFGNGSSEDLNETRSFVINENGEFSVINENNNRLCEKEIWPHPNNCSWFYKCGSNGAELLRCLEGLYFNPTLLVCVWNKPAECAITSTISTETEESSTDTLINDTNDTVTEIVGLYDYNNTLCEGRIWPHPNQCSRYYRCGPSGPQLFECHNGYYFNFTLLACDCNQPVECRSELIEINLSGQQYEQSTIFSNNENGVTTEVIEGLCRGSIWSHPNDCTKFYKCGSLSPTLFQCPDGLYFNPDLLVCDWMKSSECQTDLNDYNSEATTDILPVTETTEYNTKQIDSISTNLDEISTFTDVTDTTTSLPGLIENITELCPSTMWPHPNDCTKFYTCGATGPTEFDCPGNLHFSPKLLVCTWPYLADCQSVSDLNLGTTENTIGSGETVLSESSRDSEEDTSILYGKLHLSDVEESSQFGVTTHTSLGVILPHPSDCTKFYLCDSQGPVEFSCPGGLYFDSNTLVCIGLTPLVCHSNLNKTNEPVVTTTGSVESVEVTSSSIDKQNVNSCRGDTWPHSTDCTKFYVCGSNGPIEVSCPNQFHFDPEILVCDWPQRAGCRVKKNGFFFERMKGL